MNKSNLSRVIESIAQTTRYPSELLTPEADLENDLGIDSVKRLEIVVALSDEFGVRLDLEERDASIRTIEQVASWVEKVVSREGAGEAPLSSGDPDENLATQAGENTSALGSPGPAGTGPGGTGPGGTGPGSPGPGSGIAKEVSRDTFSVSDDLKANEATSSGAGTEQSPIVDSQFYRNISPSFRMADESNPIVDAPSPSPVPRPHFGNGSAPRSETTNRFETNEASGDSDGKPLRGRVALVTGSGRGVGKTIARLLAARGATVIINSFHSRELGEQTAAEINQAGGAAIHLWGSVANPRQVDHIFEQIEQHFGRLDIMICNASDGRIGPFMELTLDDWDRAFRTNVTGHHQCAVKAAPLMRASGGGSIVTMSAVGATGFIDGLGSQGVVKAAVETMTRYLACELGQFGIRVNCVAGGPVYGDLLSKFPEARSTQEHWESITPDGQLCSPLDLANAIGFLVGDDAKGINGSVWMVDHGFSAMEDGRPLRASARENLVFANS